MTTINDEPTSGQHIEDPPRLSAEAQAFGEDFWNRFRALPVELRRELIKPLADTLTTTEVTETTLSSAASLELADSLEENARMAREHARHQEFMDNHPSIEPGPDLNY